MANYNRVVLMGNLTRDPEVGYTQNQTACCNFGLATNRHWSDQAGNKKEEVCFVECAAWGKVSEVVAKYVSKGQCLFIEGRLTLDQWQDQSGQNRSRLKVTVESVQLMPQGQGQGQPNQGRPAQGPPDTSVPQGDVDNIPF